VGQAAWATEKIRKEIMGGVYPKRPDSPALSRFRLVMTQS